MKIFPSLFFLVVAHVINGHSSLSSPFVFGASSPFSVEPAPHFGFGLPSNELPKTTLLEQFDQGKKYFLQDKANNTSNWGRDPVVSPLKKIGKEILLHIAFQEGHPHQLDSLKILYESDDIKLYRLSTSVLFKILLTPHDTRRLETATLLFNSSHSLRTSQGERYMGARVLANEEGPHRLKAVHLLLREGGLFGDLPQGSPAEEEDKNLALKALKDMLAAEPKIPEWSSVYELLRRHAAHALDEETVRNLVHLMGKETGGKEGPLVQAARTELRNLLNKTSPYLELDFYYDDRKRDKIPLKVEGVKVLSEELTLDPALQRLSLKGEPFGSEGGVALGQALERNKTLTFLDLQSSQIGAVGVKAVMDALLQNRSLLVLKLGWNELGVKGAMHIAEALALNPSITSLTLSGNKLTQEGLASLCQALERNTILRELELDRNSFESDSGHLIASLLKKNTPLTSLDLEANTLGPIGCKILGEALQFNTHLTFLSLAGNGIYDEGALALIESLKKNTTIKKINVEGGLGIGGNYLSSEVKALFSKEGNRRIYH